MAEAPAPAHVGRQFFVGGNWKMNGSKVDNDAVIAILNGAIAKCKAGRPIVYLIRLLLVDL